MLSSTTTLTRCGWPMIVESDLVRGVRIEREGRRLLIDRLEIPISILQSPIENCRD